MTIVAWLVAIAASSLAFWLHGRNSGRKDAEITQMRRDVRTTVKAREIENEVQALDTADLERRASQWVRDPGK